MQPPLIGATTVIEIKAQGWSVFQAPGVEPVFPEKDQAINYGDLLDLHINLGNVES